MSKSFWKLVLVQFREFYREPAILFWSVVFPVAIAATLGAAFSEKTEIHQTIGFVRKMPSAGQFADLFQKAKPVDNGLPVLSVGTESSGKMMLHIKMVSEDSAIVLLKRGIIPLYLSGTSDSTVSFHFDKANSSAQLIYFMVMAETGSKETAENIKQMTLPGTRYIDFLIPGLLVFGLMNSFLWGIGFSLIEFRMKKLLRRMLATPMKRYEFILSLMVARLFLAFIEAAILLTFAFFFFGISPQGSWMGVILLLLTGAFAFTGISLLVAARVEKTNIGIGFINAISMPMMVLSGIFFSYHNFPETVVKIIQFLPLTLLADSTRAIFIEGSGFGETLIPVGILLGIGVVTFSAGLKLFRWH